MLNLGSVYLITRDWNASLRFYQALLDMPPTARNQDRWAQFNFRGHCIALYNPAYDQARIAQGGDLSLHYNAAYLERLQSRPIVYGNNAVLNFGTGDLRTEYARVKALGIGPVSAIQYVNIASPYYFFTLEDPDGNTVEITGAYEPD